MCIRRIAILLLLTASLLASQVMIPNTQIYAETPAGTVNGVNATFTLKYIPTVPSSVALFRNGVRQEVGADYTVSGNTITFAAGSIPQSGDVLLADYMTGSTASLLAVNNLSDVSNPAAALTAIGGASLTGNNAFSGAQTFNGASYFSARSPQYFTTGNAAWSEFRVIPTQGGTVGNDLFAIQYNSRSASGGTDNWWNAMYIAAITGAINFNPTVYIWGGIYLGGGGLNLNGQIISGAATFTGGTLKFNGGNVLVNTTTDNGTDRLQVAGTVNAAGFKVGTAVGVSGTITIPKLTANGTNGSITVTNGIITAFTNPN